MLEQDARGRGPGLWGAVSTRGVVEGCDPQAPRTAPWPPRTGSTAEVAEDAESLLRAPRVRRGGSRIGTRLSIVAPIAVLAAAALTAAALVSSGCRGERPSAPSPTAAPPPHGAQAEDAAVEPDGAEEIPLLNPPPAALEDSDDEKLEALARSRDPLEVVTLVQRLVAARDVARLPELFVAASGDLTPALLADQAARFVGASPPAHAEIAGRRAVVRFAGRKDTGPPVVLYEREGRWRVDLRATALWREPDRGPRDRANRPLSLDDAVAGLAGEGQLVAVLSTSAGELRCRLFEHRAPATVANFVGLARGLRAFIDPKTGAWARRPFYDGQIFHRAVPGALVQGGDPLGSGRGGPGYTLPDELDATLRHDRPGILAMASRGPNSAGSQFFITAAELPELDDHHSVFGACEPVATVVALTRVPTDDTERPLKPPTLDRVTFERVAR